MSSKKKLLIMGGMSQQLEIIKDAKKKGIHVIVVDNVPDSPGKNIADESYEISITDVEQIVDLGKKLRIDGVMNYCIDPGQKPYQMICEALNLPCYGTKEQFLILSDKSLFKQECKKARVEVVEEFSYTEAINQFLEGSRVVVKPTDGRASKGISVCKNKSELEMGIQHALENSISKKFIFEKYIRKPIVVIKYFVCDGNIYLTSVSDTHTCYDRGDRIYIYGKYFPSRYVDRFEGEVDESLRSLVQEIGILNGPLSFTAFYDDGIFRFIDPSFRMGGAQDWLLVESFSGVNMASCMTSFALSGSMGLPRDLEAMNDAFKNKHSTMVYVLGKIGEIGKIKGIQNLETISSVVGYHICHSEGSKILNKGTSDHVIMRILIAADTKKELIDDYEKVVSFINVTDPSGKSLLYPSFDMSRECR